MFHFGHFNERFLIVDSVDDSVIANSNAPFVVAAFEFLASGRPRSLREIVDLLNDPGEDSIDPRRNPKAAQFPSPPLGLNLESLYTLIELRPLFTRSGL